MTKEPLLKQILDLQKVAENCDDQISALQKNIQSIVQTEKDLAIQKEMTLSELRGQLDKKLKAIAGIEALETVLRNWQKIE